MPARLFYDELAKSPKEFRVTRVRHMCRYSTDDRYEVGGTPKAAQQGPENGFGLCRRERDLTLKKGTCCDSRGTPHQAEYAGSVTLILISPLGT